MIAVEVGVSQYYSSLRAAMSYCVCALHCRVGIAMCVDERKRRNALPIQYYDTIREVNDAVEHAQYEFRAQLPDHPYGPLITKGVSWYGRIKKITLEIFRRENEDCPPDAVLHPNKSYVSSQ
jgi:hypothetical protein